MKKLYLAVVLSLAVILAWRFLYPVERPVASKARNGNISSDVVEEALATLDIATGFMPAEIYPEIPARPVFFKERKPPEPYVQRTGEKKAAAAPRPAGAPPRFTLSGIVEIGKETFALVKVPGGKGARRLKVGEEFDGWRVREISPDKLVMSNGSAEHEIPLRKYKPVSSRGGQSKKVTRTGARRPPLKRGRPAAAKQGREQRPTEMVTE